LFAAAEAGQLTVRIIPRDEKQARILITNKTKQPLSVRLPEAFAARPILAQVRGFQLPGIQNQQGMAQAPQTFGGPVNNGNQQNGNQQNGNNNNARGVFNIPPEQVRDIRVLAVCLEYGKPHPRPQHAYEMVPLASYSSDPVLAATLVRLGEGKCNQRVAQAAAWYLASDRSWEQLAKEQGDLIGVGEHAPYFTKRELQEAKELVAAARRDVVPVKIEAAVTSQPKNSATSSSSSAAGSEITGNSTSANRFPSKP
jgi:hypothetical protein